MFIEGQSIISFCAELFSVAPNSIFSVPSGTEFSPSEKYICFDGQLYVKSLYILARIQYNF